MQWIQMVLTSFQLQCSLHAKCKHTLICMSLLTRSLSALQYITNKTLLFLHVCVVVFGALPESLHGGHYSEALMSVGEVLQQLWSAALG